MGFLKKIKDTVTDIGPELGLGGIGWQLGLAGIGEAGELYSAHEQSKAIEQQNREARSIAEQQMALQREFAQHGIRWRVEDARAAGIHPLAALGASGASYTPVSPNLIPDTSKSDYISGFSSRMGQNLQRAVMATMTPQERLIKNAEDSVHLKKLAYEDKLLDYQMTRIGQPMNPPMQDPNSGLGQQLGGGAQDLSGKVTFIPTGRTYSAEGKPFQAAGSVTDVVFRRTPTGLKIAPGPDVQGILANNMAEMLKWEIGHFAQQMVDPEVYRPSLKEHPLPKGQYWKFNRFVNEWQPRKIKKNFRWKSDRGFY